jgi:hypothetical protein
MTYRLDCIRTDSASLQRKLSDTPSGASNVSECTPRHVGEPPQDEPSRDGITWIALRIRPHRPLQPPIQLCSKKPIFHARVGKPWDDTARSLLTMHFHACVGKLANSAAST